MNSSLNVIPFKAYLNSESTHEIRRFNLTNEQVGSFTALKGKLMDVFPSLKNAADVEIFWIDEDNEAVAISSDDELQLAIKQMLPSKNLCRISVSKVLNGVESKRQKVNGNGTAATADNVDFGIPCSICQKMLSVDYIVCLERFNFVLCMDCYRRGDHKCKFCVPFSYMLKEIIEVPTSTIEKNNVTRYKPADKYSIWINVTHFMACYNEVVRAYIWSLQPSPDGKYFVKSGRMCQEEKKEMESFKALVASGRAAIAEMRLLMKKEFVKKIPVPKDSFNAALTVVHYFTQMAILFTQADDNKKEYIFEWCHHNRIALDRMVTILQDFINIIGKKIFRGHNSHGSRQTQTQKQCFTTKAGLLPPQSTHVPPPIVQSPLEAVYESLQHTANVCQNVCMNSGIPVMQRVSEMLKGALNLVETNVVGAANIAAAANAVTNAAAASFLKATASHTLPTAPSAPPTALFAPMAPPTAPSTTVDTTAAPDPSPPPSVSHFDAFPKGEIYQSSPSGIFVASYESCEPGPSSVENPSVPGSSTARDASPAKNCAPPDKGTDNSYVGLDMESSALIKLLSMGLENTDGRLTELLKKYDYNIQRVLDDYFH